MFIKKTSSNTDKDCELLHDRPVLSTGRTPHDKQNRNCFDYNQNLVVCPGEESTPRLTDWLTDWLTDRPTDRHLYNDSDTWQ
jgi:hypothetical protein